MLQAVTCCSDKVAQRLYLLYRPFTSLEGPRPSSSQWPPARPSHHAGPWPAGPVANDVHSGHGCAQTVLMSSIVAAGQQVYGTCRNLAYQLNGTGA